MPRYYIDTFDHFAAIDEEGRDLADMASVRREIHDALSTMMRDMKDGRPSVQFRADVRDGTGETIMRATLLMVVDEMR